MEGEERRKKLIDLLRSNSQPLSGSGIAKYFGVSRQVIVQDIALLRAIDKNILSTNKGYILFYPKAEPTRAKKTMHVCHTNEQIKDELYTIIDYGGTVLDVVVEHEIYGQITVDLLIKSHQDVNEFVDKIKAVQARPLKELTDGDHFHTVEADTPQLLHMIEGKLSEKGYLR
ncbi:transcription repressor NadR [Lachnospiraceae bacterium ZAX-1]